MGSKSEQPWAFYTVFIVCIAGIMLLIAGSFIGTTVNQTFPDPTMVAQLPTPDINTVPTYPRVLGAVTPVPGSMSRCPGYDFETEDTVETVLSTYRTMLPQAGWRQSYDTSVATEEAKAKRIRVFNYGLYLEIGATPKSERQTNVSLQLCWPIR
jgi:hypothetical protein